MCRIFFLKNFVTFDFLSVQERVVVVVVVVVLVVVVIMKLTKQYETNLSNTSPRKKSKPKNIGDMERCFIYALFLVLNVFVPCEMTTSKLIFCLLVFTTERHKYFDLLKLSLYFIFCMLIGSPEQRYQLIILLLPNMVK